jgi:hypothetical protein
LKGATIALAGDLFGDLKLETPKLGAMGLEVSSGPVDMESPDSALGETHVRGSSGLFISVLFKLSTAIELPSSSEEEVWSGDTGVLPFTWSSMEPVVLVLRRLKLNLLNFMERRDRERVGFESTTATPCCVSSDIFSKVPLRINLPGGGSEVLGGGAWLLDIHTLVSLGFQRLEFSSALAFCFESSTFFHKLAILLVTFFFGGVFFCSRGSWGFWEVKAFLGLGATAGFLAEGFALNTLLSMSELEGTLFGAILSAAGRDCFEEEARNEVLEILEVLEAAEEVLEVEDLTGPPLLKDCSLKVWVLFVPPYFERGLGPVCTSSLHWFDLVAFFVGETLELSFRLGETLEMFVLFREDVLSSFVKVPCLTKGDCCKLLGDRMFPGDVRLLGLTNELPVLFKLLGEFKLRGEEGDLELVDVLLSFLPALCLLSWVALVPLGSLGELTGEEEVLGREEVFKLGLGGTAGGTVALFMGGE